MHATAEFPNVVVPNPVIDPVRVTVPVVVANFPEGMEKIDPEFTVSVPATFMDEDAVDDAVSAIVRCPKVKSVPMLNPAPPARVELNVVVWMVADVDARIVP